MAITWFEVRDARLLAGISQSELALRMGVSSRSVQNYEKPDGTIPRKAEHGLRRVLGSYLDQLNALHAAGVYRSSADGDLSSATEVSPSGAQPILNPRLAGISNAEMLRELLARDTREAGEQTSDEAEPVRLRPVVGGYSQSEVKDIVRDAEAGHLQSAAGMDETAPTED